MKVHADRRSPLSSKSGQRFFWQDKLFWLAISCGPVVWTIAYLLLADSSKQNGWGFPDLTILFWSVLVYPPLEEIIFRGGLQPALLSVSRLSRARFGITYANVVTSAVFAAVHLVTLPPLWALLVFVPSLVFGAARDRYDGIAASIVLHMFYNAGFVGWLVR